MPGQGGEVIRYGNMRYSRFFIQGLEFSALVFGVRSMDMG